MNRTKFLIASLTFLGSAYSAEDNSSEKVLKPAQSLPSPINNDAEHSIFGLERSVSVAVMDSSAAAYNGEDNNIVAPAPSLASVESEATVLGGAMSHLMSEVTIQPNLSEGFAEGDHLPVGTAPLAVSNNN